MRATKFLGLLAVGLLLAAQPLQLYHHVRPNYAGADLHGRHFPGLDYSPVLAGGFSSSSFSSSRSFSSPSFSSSRSYSSPSYSSPSSYSSRSSYSSPSYSSPSRPSFSSPSPSTSKPSFGWSFSKPAAAPTPRTFTSSAVKVAPSSPFKPAPAYRVANVTTKATYQPSGLRAAARPLPPAGSLLRTGYAPVPLRVSPGGFATPINTPRAAYAGANYRGLYYQPTVINTYQQESFPFFQFWLWNQAFNHPYGQAYPVGYGPQMGANGAWASQGPAVYDWRRDPCSPKRFFLVRMLFCHRR